jgi:uracil-DNA glycosylase
MSQLVKLLEGINDCRACNLMVENNELGIPYIPILPKLEAKIVFIGRDPSPRTANIVGVHEGGSIFIEEIFQLSNDAGIDEKDFYITDLCKCHWRTSSGGKPLPGTESRSTRLDQTIANTCLNKWLISEIEILNPSLLVGFGEELYEIIRDKIIYPDPPLREFSAKADKSVPDAELWFAEYGSMIIKLRESKYQFALVRHPGNTSRLKPSDEKDKRLDAYNNSRKRLVEELSNAIQR